MDIGHFSPSTYAASTLCQTLPGPVAPRLALDLLVLLALGLALLVGQKMTWRQI